MRSGQCARLEHDRLIDVIGHKIKTLAWVGVMSEAVGSVRVTSLTVESVSQAGTG